MKKVTFDNSKSKGFMTEVRKSVDEYFSKMENKLGKRGAFVRVLKDSNFNNYSSLHPHAVEYCIPEDFIRWYMDMFKLSKKKEAGSRNHL